MSPPAPINDHTLDPGSVDPGSFVVTRTDPEGDAARSDAAVTEASVPAELPVAAAPDDPDVTGVTGVIGGDDTDVTGGVVAGAVAVVVDVDGASGTHVAVGSGLPRGAGSFGLPEPSGSKRHPSTVVDFTRTDPGPMLWYTHEPAGARK